MRTSSLHELNDAKLKRLAAVCVTDFSRGEDRVFIEGQEIDHPAAAQIEHALHAGRSGVVQTDDGEIFLNVQRPPPVVVIIGAVHISQSLARMARMSDFDVRIIDPRRGFATAERFKHIDVVADWPIDVLGVSALDRHTALIALTHDPKIDDWPIGQALSAGCFYVGALGSRKTHASRLERLRAQGFEDGDLARIHAPVGLDIGAATPAEIAVAILAEIIEASRAPGRARGRS